MSLQKQIKEDLMVAFKNKESVKVDVLRGVLSNFTNELLANKQKPDEELEDEKAMEVLRRASRQREDSISQFEKGGREELAEREKEELAIIKEYLPQMMEKSEVEEFVKQKADELGITEKSEMGKLIGAVMQELKGKAEGADVKKAVDEYLS